MARLFKKRYNLPGTAPGTLPEIATTGVAAKVTSMVYDPRETDLLREDFLDNILVPKNGKQLWIHVQGTPDTHQLNQLGQQFDLHPLALEDVANVGQRPKMDLYEKVLFVVMGMPVLVGEDLHVADISLFLGQDFVISVCEGAEDPFVAVRKRLQNGGGRLRQMGADFLFYALIDTVVDQAYPVLETLGETIETLEVELLERPSRDMLGQLHLLKRELILLRRQLWPARDLLSQMMRSDLELLHPETRGYFRDAHDHAVQIIDLIESYRDITASMLDVYLSSMSHRLNDIMRVLTVITTIFMPLSFIAGLYGMNFVANEKSPWAMPELRTTYGYPVVLGVMLIIAVGMLVSFKRNGWLR
ncbi:MAG: magnesium/cobalt transporter CorA [Pseudomonadota bacterium]|jgi:magnesium transporter